MWFFSVKTESKLLIEHSIYVEEAILAFDNFPDRLPSGDWLVDGLYYTKANRKEYKIVITDLYVQIKSKAQVNKNTKVLSDEYNSIDIWIFFFYFIILLVRAAKSHYTMQRSKAWSSCHSKVHNSFIAFPTRFTFMLILDVLF